MKANELMIGDLVRVTEDVCIKKGTIVKIVGIDATRTLPKHGLVGCTLCTPLNHDDGLHGGYGGVWTAFLEPIPLTAEILEKNGFKRYGTSYILKESMFELTNPSNPDRYLDNYYIRLARQNKRVMYVHKLQHFMREFGIEKEIKI